MSTANGVRHYLDCASTTPLRPQALEAMLPWLTGGHGDPSRQHQEGLSARSAVEEAREKVADLVGASPREVVFTSGATESIVTATAGVRRGDRDHVVFSAVEHAAVRETSLAGPHSIVGAASDGTIDPEEMASAVTGTTGLVHCQWANHEVGTCQPVSDVVDAVRNKGNSLVHADAAAAVGHVPVDFRALHLDLMSVSSHKFGGPTGVGALIVRRGLRIPPLLVGGNQERARRAGMENVAAIVGFGAAAADASRHLDEEALTARRFTDMATAAILRTSGVRQCGNPEKRLPHIACFEVEGVLAEPILLHLDSHGIALHSGSSCSSESLEPSPVLTAMAIDPERSLRLSVGWSTMETDIEAFAKEFEPAVTSLRALGNS